MAGMVAKVKPLFADLIGFPNPMGPAGDIGVLATEGNCIHTFVAVRVPSKSLLLLVLEFADIMGPAGDTWVLVTGKQRCLHTSGQ